MGFEPVAFFSHFQFKASARDFATNILKDVVDLLKYDDDERIKDWAKRYSEYDYQVTARVFFFLYLQLEISYSLPCIGFRNYFY